MNPFIVFYNFIVSLISPLLVFVARRWGNRFYLFLAAVFSVLIAVDAEYLHVTEKMQHGAFDFMMSHRIIVMCEGRITGELTAAEATQEEIMRLATQRRVLVSADGGPANGQSIEQN